MLHCCAGFTKGRKPDVLDGPSCSPTPGLLCKKVICGFKKSDEFVFALRSWQKNKVLLSCFDLGLPESCRAHTHTHITHGHSNKSFPLLHPPDAFLELRHPSVWRTPIDFRVTGRRMGENEEAQNSRISSLLSSPSLLPHTFVTQFEGFYVSKGHQSAVVTNVQSFPNSPQDSVLQRTVWPLVWHIYYTRNTVHAMFFWNNRIFTTEIKKEVMSSTAFQQVWNNDFWKGEKKSQF